jgi:hypothetical protein
MHSRNKAVPDSLGGVAYAVVMPPMVWFVVFSVPLVVIQQQCQISAGDRVVGPSLAFDSHYPSP